MSKYGRFTFPADPELKRKAGSDWLKDTGGKWRKVRSWSAPEGKWNLTTTGKAYYKSSGDAEYVISVPVHYVIGKKDGSELSYRGYFPVSQLRPSLRESIRQALARRGNARAEELEEIKQAVLESLDVVTPATSLIRARDQAKGGGALF